ncbi:BTAD domain-containing putative transcriptional regulator [Actinoplanes sp. CA-142083]|uniref:AfsR/SARP family transcriptional regulator n=1 Tax=Actinoplanes sp. CA-142083 TaxID=3239903 RepID=UPI003D8EB6A3
MTDVRLRLLGTVELHVDGKDVPLGPARQRTVLAALAVDAGRAVQIDTLVDRVWGLSPPDQVRGVVYSYVNRLRRALRVAPGRVALARRSGGYALDIDPPCVDLLLFDRLARGGSLEELDAALALWRGPALADLTGEWVSRTRDLLAQRRLDATTDWARAQLTAGRAEVVVDALRPLVEEHPLVEPLAALFIEALHRQGRGAEALDQWAAVRRHLVAELGAEPGPQLRALHQALLRPAAYAPSSLPADTAAFTGRRREIDRLLRAGPGVQAIAGMPGVGKTALAVHVAHRLRDAFPDGQVFVNLHGHTAGRDAADPADVLATLLTADGLDPRRLPSGVEARSALWRSRMAGRRALVVLDNAVDSAQVTPLLPAAAGCLVLITSRRFLGDLPADAVPVSLDVLGHDEAGAMFRRLAPTSVDDPAELLAACGHLPLAVALLARLLRRHPGWTVADLLRETRERLLDVTAEHASIAAAFDLSYRHLPTTRQRFFSLLALHPGTEFEPYAAAALAGVPVSTAVAELDALHADNLLTEVGRRRYTMHDLIRSYLSGRSPTSNEQGRLLDYYAATAKAANARLARLARPGATPPLAERIEPLAWLRTERANLLACLASTGEPARIVALTAGMAELLRRDGPWSAALALHTEAVRHATGPDRCDALVDLATMRRLTGDYPGAAGDARTAVNGYRATGERLGEANALIVLAKALSRAAGYIDAMPVVERALGIYRSLGDRPGETGALVELAIARGMTSDFRGAQDLLRQALDQYRSLADRPGEAYTLRILGIAHGRVGDFAGARELLTGALGLYRELGARLGEALTHNDLGRAATGLGDYPSAVDSLRAALRSHRRSGHLVGQSAALLYLGAALRRSGDLAGAATALEEALALDREIHNRSGEAMVLNELGALHRLAGDIDRALTAHRAALALADQVSSPFDRALSLAGFGRCAVARGRTREGAAQLRTALRILREIDAAEATEVEADLAAVT